MLFGKVTDFNVRGNLRAPTAPSKSQNPFFLPGFEALDSLVCVDFLNSLPQLYKHTTSANDPSDGSTLDTDLYMVHIIPHAYVPQRICEELLDSFLTQGYHHFAQSLHRFFRCTLYIHRPMCRFRTGNTGGVLYAFRHFVRYYKVAPFRHCQSFPSVPLDTH
jgi:hypothetical protein